MQRQKREDGKIDVWIRIKQHDPQTLAIAFPRNINLQVLQPSTWRFSQLGRTNLKGGVHGYKPVFKPTLS